jgi:arylformamidase
MGRHNSQLIDISLPISSDLPRWPGDPPVELDAFLDFPEHGVRASRLSFSLHTGTHVDAPLHHDRSAADAEALDLDPFIGPVTVVDSGDAARVSAALLDQHLGASTPERLLVRTRNSGRWRDARDFDPDFVALTADAARWVVDRGIRLIGVDYLSVQSYHDTDPTVHKTLLGAGVVILEGLDLSGVEVARRYELLCLPLRVRGGEAAPCRAILRPVA